MAAVKKINMQAKKSEMLKEHKHLVKVLRTGSKSKRLSEAKKQSQELKKYK